jgi:hypothetical protein
MRYLISTSPGARTNRAPVDDIDRVPYIHKRERQTLKTSTAFHVKKNIEQTVALRRIREQLRTMDLDWDQPSFPEEAEESKRAPSRSIRVVGPMLKPSAGRTEP